MSRGGDLYCSRLSVIDKEDTITGLRNEVLWRQARLKGVYKDLWTTSNFPEFNFQKEVDAHLIELGIDVLREAYPAWVEFHQQDMLKNAQELHHPIEDFMVVKDNFSEDPTPAPQRLTEVMNKAEAEQLSWGMTLFYFMNTVSTTLLKSILFMIDEENANDDNQTKGRRRHRRHR